MKREWFFVLLVLIVFITGCVGEKTLHFLGQDKDTLYSKAKTSLVMNGFDIVREDKSLGILVARKYREETPMSARGSQGQGFSYNPVVDQRVYIKVENEKITIRVETGTKELTNPDDVVNDFVISL